MYEAILSNGDRAEGEDEAAVLLAAATLRRDAVEHGATPRIARETIVTHDDVYHARLTNLAQEGALCS